MSGRQIHLANDLALPLDAVTETFGILAARGAGKSNLAAVMAEGMAEAGLPFVVVDPVGSWYGLRAGADGTKGGGLPIPIFGGKHGDVPLERHGGELVADLVVSQRLSCVLDLSTFESEGTKKAFLLDFARRLYLKNEDPLHLFLEEADDYIPQRPMRDEAQLLRAWENIVRRGRARGLGMTVITQRSASLNKSVLTQVQTLFVLRTTGPQDRAAIEAWVKYHDTDETLLASLSGLGPGEGWVWSPQFLQTMSRHQFHRRRTFDSGATPKNLRGKEAKRAATLADVDLGVLQTQMAATVERAKQDDPKELRKQLAEKDKRIRDLEASAKQAPNYSKSIPSLDKPVLTDTDRELLKDLRKDLNEFVDAIADRADATLNSIAMRAKAEIDRAAGAWIAQVDNRRALWVEHFGKTRIQKVLDKLDRVAFTPSPIPGKPESRHTTANSTVVQAPAARPPRAVLPSASGAGEAMAAGALTPGQQAVVNTLAMLEVRGIPSSLDTLCAWLDLHPNGGRFRGNLRLLQDAGYLDGYELTDRGRASARPGPTGVDAAKGKLTPGQLSIVEALEAAGRPLTIEGVAEHLGLHPNGGRFRGNVTRVREMGLVAGREMKLTEGLYR